jgi:hypothetical protein
MIKDALRTEAKQNAANERDEIKIRPALGPSEPGAEHHGRADGEPDNGARMMAPDPLHMPTLGLIGPAG